MVFIFYYRCHASSGKCDCTPGWTGIYCDTPCPAGHYGQDCQEKCECKNGAACDHVTGKKPQEIICCLYVVFESERFFQINTYFLRRKSSRMKIQMTQF